MKKITLLLFVSALSFTKVNAQITFVKTYTTPGSVSDGFSIVEDIAGGYLFTGMSQDTITYTGTAFLAKCDSLGDIDWVKSYDTSIIYPTMKRFVNGDLLLGGGQYIMKLDNSGNVLWARHISGISSVQPDGFIITSDGGIVISSYIQVQANFSMKLIKLDSIGDLVWAMETPLSGNSIRLNNVIETVDGGLLTAFDEDITNLSQQICVIKTDGSGNLLWSKTFGSVNYDHVSDLIQSADGNYVLSGIISGSTCIFKLDTSGAIIWSKTYGQNDIGVKNILETTTGNLILAGNYVDSLIGDGLVFSTDAFGNILYARSYSGVYWAYINDLYATSDLGYIAVCADGIANPGNPSFLQFLKLIKMDSLLYSACDFQTINFGVASQVLNTQPGSYLIPSNVSSSPITINQYPYQMTATVVCKSINVDELIIDDLIDLYPNPAANKVDIEFDSGLIRHTAIFDIAGKLWKDFYYNNSKLEIDVSTLAPGIYFLTGTSDQGTFRKRFVKN
ncbi:MAG: T9SS type A sorting domain-containing protein [Bacteroidetes bacterium]|nr:T9SS type A sorting domain-containing protein [Bacteroidota bacterium]